MATHLNEVGAEARSIFADVKSIGRRVLDRFYEGFEKALKDVNKGWRHLKPRERKIVFEKVQDVAKEIIVSVKDGGSAKEDEGLSLGTFYGYVCKVKRALVFNVPLHIAERATNQELQRTETYAEEVLRDAEGTRLEKMTQGYEWVKNEQVKEKERLRAEAQKNAGKGKNASAETHFTLPDPDDFESGDSNELLENGIQHILSWLQTKSLQPHLQMDIPAATVLRRCLGELTAYVNEHELEEAVA